MMPQCSIMIQLSFPMRVIYVRYPSGQLALAEKKCVQNGQGEQDDASHYAYRPDHIAAALLILQELLYQSRHRSLL